MGPATVLILQIYQYAQPITKKGKAAVQAEGTTDNLKRSHHAQRNLDARKKGWSLIVAINPYLSRLCRGQG